MISQEIKMGNSYRNDATGPLKIKTSSKFSSSLDISDGEGKKEKSVESPSKKSNKSKKQNFEEKGKSIKEQKNKAREDMQAKKRICQDCNGLLPKPLSARAKK